MAAVEFELFVSDPRNPMVGGTARFTADGEPVREATLTAAQYHYLLGAIAREFEDLLKGEAHDVR